MFTDRYSSRTQNRQAGIHQSVVHNNEPVQNYSEQAKRESIPAKNLLTQIDSAVVKSVHDGVVQLPNQQKDLKSKEYKKNTQNLLRAINKKDWFEILDLLNEGNLDINVKDKDGRTALILAVEHKHISIVDSLRKYKNIDINVKDKNDRTALMLAVEHKHVSIVNSLLKYKNIDINTKDKNDMTALMLAVEHKNVSAVDSLRKYKNIDINAKDKNGRTALILAVEHKNISIVDNLLKYENIDINTKDKNDMTALMLAVEHKNISVVRSLLAAGADIDIKNSEHIQALQNAFFGLKNFKAMLPILAELNSDFSKQEYKIDNTEYITLSYTLQGKTYKFDFIKDKLINSIRELLHTNSLQDRAKVAIYDACGMRKSNLDKLNSLLPDKFIEYLKSGRTYSVKTYTALQKLLEKVLK